MNCLKTLAEPWPPCRAFCLSVQTGFIWLSQVTSLQSGYYISTASIFLQAFYCGMMWILFVCVSVCVCWYYVGGWIRTQIVQENLEGGFGRQLGLGSIGRRKINTVTMAKCEGHRLGTGTTTRFVDLIGIAHACKTLPEKTKAQKRNPKQWFPWQLFDLSLLGTFWSF